MFNPGFDTPEGYVLLVVLNWVFLIVVFASAARATYYRLRDDPLEEMRITVFKWLGVVFLIALVVWGWIDKPIKVF